MHNTEARSRTSWNVWLHGFEEFYKHAQSLRGWICSYPDWKWNFKGFCRWDHYDWTNCSQVICCNLISHSNWLSKNACLNKCWMTMGWVWGPKVGIFKICSAFNVCCLCLAVVYKQIGPYTVPLWEAVLLTLNHLPTVRRSFFLVANGVISTLMGIISLKHCQRHNGPEGWVHITKTSEKTCSILWLFLLASTSLDRFDKPWWAQGEEGLKIVWTKEEVCSCPSNITTTFFIVDAW